MSARSHLLLISASVPVDERVANHRRAIDAALAAGVSLVAYTSTLQADTAATIIGATHRATEEYLRERRVPSVLLPGSRSLTPICRRTSSPRC
jgi:NAD(P)H dehydrogenase (quinone)